MTTLTGKRFGHLVVLAEVPIKIPGQRQRRWVLVLCDCGTTKTSRLDNLTSGRSISCGCVRMERAREATTTHGGAQGPLYTTWSTMIQRCTNPNRNSYANYGARGISVCPEWMADFACFRADVLRVAGPKPGPGFSLDRIDNECGYGPENVRWATRSQQVRNSRQAKLTDDQRTYIRANYVRGRGPYDRGNSSTLAAEFGVHPMTIRGASRAAI